MALLEKEWIYSVRAVLYFLPASKKIFFSIQPVFNYNFSQGQCPGCIAISVVFCSVSIRRLSLISGVLQELSQYLLGVMDEWAEVAETVVLLKQLMQKKGILSQVKPNGEWEEVESEVLNMHQGGNFQHFSPSLLQKQIEFCNDLRCVV